MPKSLRAHDKTYKKGNITSKNIMLHEKTKQYSVRMRQIVGPMIKKYDYYFLCLVVLFIWCVVYREYFWFDRLFLFDKTAGDTLHQFYPIEYFKISTESFLSQSRKREFVQARQIAMYISRNMTNNSLASIGAQIGGRDHATVLHAYNTVKDLIDTNRSFRKYVSDIEGQLKSN